MSIQIPLAESSQGFLLDKQAILISGWDTTLFFYESSHKKCEDSFNHLSYMNTKIYWQICKNTRTLISPSMNGKIAHIVKIRASPLVIASIFRWSMMQ